MSVVAIDERGRLTLPSEVRKSLNMENKVLLINAGDHVKLIPLPSASFESLNGVLDIDKPFKQIREEAERAAHR
jgi:bifunctional DNA-binding transcriptional regulator/antitoxin component of YhaV-PrlF toxin-antitoxin module